MMLSLKNISKTYNIGKKNETPVLHDVSIDFPEKGMVAIHGRSGCGKTTLLNIIGANTKQDRGVLIIDGMEYACVNEEYRVKNVGFIYQNYCLDENRSVYENVSAPLMILGIKDEKILKERVDEALSVVGMELYSGRSVSTLSGGQKQRIAIARAIVKNPQILLADEPTGNLDEKNTVVIMKLLKKLSKEQLVILVTHETNLIEEYCDSVYEINDDGEVSCTKSSTEILETKKYENSIEKPSKKIRYGKLYSLKNVLSEAKNNSQMAGKGSKALKWCLFLAAMVLVVLTSIFSIGVKKLAEIKEVANPNTFYGVVRKTEEAQKLMEYEKKHEYGIKNVELTNYSDCRDTMFLFDSVKYDNDFVFYWEDNVCPITVSAITLPDKLMEGKKIIWGDSKYANENDVVITTALADKILSSNISNYFRDYTSILGFRLLGTNRYRISGIAESNESIIYVSKDSQIKNRFTEDQQYVKFVPDEKIPNGKVTIKVDTTRIFDKLHQSGDTVTVNGKNLTVQKCIDSGYPYEKWLEENKYTDVLSYHTEKATLDELNKYYSRYSEYLKYCYENRDTVTWNEIMQLALEGNISAYRHLLVDDCGNVDLYRALLFQDHNGRFPTGEELDIAVELYDEMAAEEEKNFDVNSSDYCMHVIYYMNPADYEEAGKNFGEYAGIGFAGEREKCIFAVIYSDNVRETEDFVSNFFEKNVNQYGFSYTTPQKIYAAEQKQLLKEYLVDFWIWLVFAIAVIIMIYSAVNASIAKGIKEIATGRLIGVSKNNLRFKYIMENLSVFIKTAGLGIIFSSVVIVIIQNCNIFYGINDLLFYPVYLALGIFAFFSLVTVICVLLIIKRILRKEPGEIMNLFT